MSPPPAPVPKEWPKEVAALYDPVRTLGKGGFASVTLAKEKAEPKTMVAMKIVGASSNMFQRAYAHREMDILRELNHPNIMKVLDSWEPKVGPSILALSYAKGPTVEALLRHGGALSTIFSRVVFAQVTDAVAYLHSHAVVHRDIKPDNVVVTGAFSKDNCIWDNEDEAEERLKDSLDAPKNNRDEVRGAEYWASKRSKWKATLVDFGFARALTPKDVSKPSLQIRRENVEASYHAVREIDLEGTPKRKSRISISLKRGQSNSRLDVSQQSMNSSRNSIDGSRHSTGATRQSKTIRRVMSAVGNKLFAAPEILAEMHEEDHDDPVKLTDTIGHTVSEYGLMVDAYSLGSTLRYMMTGCLPHVRVRDAIADQKSCMNVLFSSCANRKKKRDVQYRLEEDLPGEAHRLISKMTEKAETKRTSVRQARNYIWVSDVLPESQSGGPIEYLKIASEEPAEEGKA